MKNTPNPDYPRKSKSNSRKHNKQSFRRNSLAEHSRRLAALNITRVFPLIKFIAALSLSLWRTFQVVGNSASRACRERAREGERYASQICPAGLTWTDAPKRARGFHHRHAPACMARAHIRQTLLCLQQQQRGEGLCVNPTKSCDINVRRD